jgi:DNA-3-methyladenine glycosylase
VAPSNQSLLSQRLPRSFYDGPPQQVAQRMLGQMIVRAWPNGTIASGIIVEVEAYLSSGDLASHSLRGPGKRNASMFMPAGTLYVYSIHNRHCMNVVTEAAGTGSAILIRAAEPFTGRAIMLGHVRREQRFRGGNAVFVQSSADGPNDVASPWTLAGQRLLTSGPGRLCRALDVDRRLDGVDLASSDQIWLAAGPDEVRHRAWSWLVTERIGISRDTQHPLRWLVDGNQFVSGLARHHSCGRTWRFRQSA